MEPTLFLNLKAVVNRYRWRLLFTAATVAISNFLLVINPLIFRQAVMAVTPQENAVHSPLFIKLFGPYYSSIWPWGLLLIAVAFIAASLKYRMRVGFFSVGRDVERDTRAKLFNQIQMQSMAFFDRHGTGELLSRMTNDINAYRDVLGPGLLYPLFFLTIVIPAIVALFVISVPLAALSLLPLAAFPLFNSSLRGIVFKLSTEVQQKLADLSNMAQEHYAGIRVVRSYVIENNCYRLFAALCKELSRYNFKLVCFLGIIFPFFITVSKTVTLLSVLVAAAIVLKAWGTLNAADFVSFIWIQTYIFFPLLMLGWILPIFARGSAAYRRLYEIYMEPIEVHEGTNANLKIPEKAPIKIVNLSFSYPGAEQEALENINLEIPAGTFVGFAGPVGGGKSSLFKLLNREYEVPRGHIFIGEHDIRDYTFEALHRAIVTVEQAPFLFSKTIAENVRFGREEASQREVETVSKYAELHETVLEFPAQYETEIGERGVTLSGGQKQRVALARAFLVERSILLLDDIFSAVDTETEHKIFQSLKSKFKGKTVLLITHRFSILEQMDRVIYVAGGKIVEDGTPEALLRQKGSFAALAELQSFA